MDLLWLHDAPLISIDLSGSNTWNIQPLEQNPTLQEINLVGWLNKDYTRLDSLPQLKRVIVNFADVATVKKALQTIPHPPEVIGQ